MTLSDFATGKARLNDKPDDKPGKTEKSDIMVCRNCNQSTATWRSKCEHCHEPLENKSDSAYFQEHPPRLKAYVIFVASVAALLIILGTALILYDGHPDEVAWGYILIVMSLFNLILCWGLWHIKNWARWIVIVVNGLGVLAGVFVLMNGNFAAIGSLLVNVALLRWFWQMDYYFYK